MSKRIIIGYHDVRFGFTDYSKNQDVDVLIQQGFANGDSDMGKAADTVISGVRIIGFFPDVYKIFSKVTSSNQDINLVKQQGRATALVIVDGKIQALDYSNPVKKDHITITFKREQGGWVLWIKGPYAHF